MQNGVYTTAAGASMTSYAGYEVTYYENNFSVQEQTYTQSIGTAPVILPNVSQEEGENGVLHYHVNGNMYFPSGSSTSLDREGDLYLYYTVEGDNVENTNMAATDRSADFYYTYYATRKQDTNGISYDYVGREKQENLSEEQYLVTVYGYRNVKESAASLAGTVPDFSAIQMYSGNLYVRGGRYTSYFGEDSTYCVRATGGYMAVEEGSFEALGAGACVSINYAAGVNTQQDYLRVDSGNFYSEVGDTIHVSGGVMRVNGGTFDKVAPTTDVDEAGINNAAIHVSGGQLTLSGGTFSLTGNSLYGIHVDASGGTTSALAEEEMATISNASFKFAGVGEYNYAIYSNYGKLSATDVDFVFEGASTNNRGIFVEGADAAATVTRGSFDYQGGGSNNAGIYSAGGTVTTDGTSFTFASGNYNYGIQTASGAAANVQCTDSTFKINGTFSAGILSYGGEITIDGTFGCEVNDPSDRLSSTAISTEGGVIYLNATGAPQQNGNMIETNGLGITSRGNGTIKIGNNLSINSTRGTAIYMSGGTLTIESTAQVDIVSQIDQNTIWVTPPEVAGDANTEIYNGIYIEGGSLLSYGTLNVTHTGVQNNRYEGTDYAFLNQQIKSYAVRIAGTGSANVTITSGRITNSVGGGVYVSGGNVSLGSENDSSLIIYTTGNGISTTGDSVNGSWGYNQSLTGGHAVEVGGGELTIKGGSYIAAHGNGILVRNTQNTTGNIVSIEGGTFLGGYNKTDGRQVGPGASYGLYVMSGGITVNISGGTFGSKDSLTSVGNVTIGNNSAAAFYGTPQGRATVNITGGNFYAYEGDVMSIFRFADVSFGTENDRVENVNLENGGNTQTCGISIQDDLLYTGNSGRGSNLTIYGADTTNTFKIDAFGSGIYYGGSVDKVSIHGGSIYGEENGNTGAGFKFSNAPSVENALTVSGGTIYGNGYGIDVYSALNATHALVISGGTIGSANTQYGVYYGASAAVDDGLLIEGGTFIGSSFGFYFNVNPWSQGPRNNVAIVGGTFRGNRAFGSRIEDIKVGDVFTEHNRQNNRYATFGGYNGSAGAGEGGSVSDISGREFTLTTNSR